MGMTILITAGAVLGVFLLIVATRPSDFRITRSITVTAPPAAVFVQVNDFHKWDAWSPWAKMGSPGILVAFRGRG